MLFAPFEGWRHVQVTDRRTAIDYAHILKDLSDIHFPRAKKIRPGSGQSQHTCQSLALRGIPACRSQRMERFEWRYTPKHGSWLNMAESELGVLASQCLDRRIPDKETLTREVAAWENSRNKHQTKADWRFTTADARIKLKRLYPQFE